MTDDRDLEAVFTQMRAQEVPVSAALLDQVMQDAEKHMPSAIAPVHARRRPILTRLVEGLGGWPSLGGLAAAGVAGFWFGLTPPAAFSEYTSAVWGDTVAMPLMEDDVFAGWDG